MDQYHIAIIGAGIAGVSAARTIAERDGGSVLLINGEPEAPYKRTRASKHIAGGFQPEDFALESAEWYARHGVTLLNGVQVDRIDLTGRALYTDNGDAKGFDKLILAVGSQPLFPRTVRPNDADSFFVVRSAGDVHRLTKAARAAKRVLIDGMGVLAVEVAAELRKMGVQVTLAGAAAQLMPRQLSIRAAEIMENLLTSNDVTLRFQEEILSFEPRKKGGFAVAMIRDSATFDLVVLCIGVAPRTELARNTGVDVNNGIMVDEHLRTSAPDVYAAGDAAEHRNGHITELWHAAEYQGRIAALNALGEPTIFDDPPFRLKCEVWGSYFFSVNKPRNTLDYDIVEREQSDTYQCFYCDGETVKGAVMVNDADRAKLYEQVVREGWSTDRAITELQL